ncbi:MAG TPA: hypothetical protein VJZ93_02450 [Candidatus Nanoarchaeia archaeon]|nr:hypothetical protein [Candidatus Nanoarchaeia archaeon]
MNKKNVSYDILGNIALIKFPFDMKLSEKKKFSEKFLKKNRSVRTILEKVSKFQGRLRKQETKYVLGEKTKEVIYKENGCVFRFNIDSSYFSPRLSNERKEISKKIRKNEDVLVMFSGVNPYGIVIAKNSLAKKVYSLEINREANKYAKLNAQLNNLNDKIETIQGDVKKFVLKARKRFPKKFDVIVMPRPQLTETFLKEAFLLSKKNTRIYYYDFCEEDEIPEVKEKIFQAGKESGRKIKILETKKAGEIAPYRLRVRVDFKVV